MRHRNHAGASGEEATTAGRPPRPADRNRELVERADPATEASLLPSLDDGLVLLELEQSRGVAVLQSLVLDHLLVHDDGPAWWIDADGYATTTTLAKLAPSRRLLDRIHVARGFEPYQHFGIVNDLRNAVGRYVRDDSPRTPSVIVAPAFDAEYRAAETLSEQQAQTLQSRGLARLRASADAYDSPVLLTRVAADGFSEPIATAADHRLRCERTRFGPRFVGDEHETLVYPVGEGLYQTTFAYWHHVLDARARQVGIDPSETPQAGPDDPVGTAVTASGERTSRSPNPLQDAWLGAAGGR
jgi:hypothetical protein